MKKEIIAMILAGGQGSRLREITEEIAKPAVSFAGKYRIIDFALSNCSNSNIDTVGILTQYKPLTLNAHVGIGSSWDLDKQYGGVKILPPYMSKEGGRFYKGTANAIYENINYIDTYNPEYVLILSGDHIYKMDYMKMLDDHKKKNSDVTIAVIEVPWEETNRFGILNTKEDDQIYEFEEKPAEAKSNLASMGIYIFNWSILREYLVNDENDPTSKNDFGKNIIPKILEDQRKISAYRFKGYWKDVGTVQSLWEANMDIIKLKPEFDLHDRKWRTYSVNPVSPPQFISPYGMIESSLINEGCIIEGSVKNSVISPDVYVGIGSHVVDSVVMSNVTIEEDVKIYKAVVINDVTIPKGTVIGDPDSDEITVYAGENNVEKA
jgi:glucose-1-phosphate adenylyltransferase